MFVQTYHTPSSVRQQQFKYYHTRFYHTPKHTLWVFGRAITPPFYHPPSFITPPKHTLWVFGRPITPPVLSHPPWAPCELHFITRGTCKISPPPQNTTPGGHVIKSQKCYHRGVLSCVSYGNGLRVSSVGSKMSSASSVWSVPELLCLTVSFVSLSGQVLRDVRVVRRQVLESEDVSRVVGWCFWVHVSSV